MKNQIQRAVKRAGFTLVEVLVTLVLIALLIGVIVPSVISQLGAGEAPRVAGDLEAVRSAAKLFRVDVRRFPGTPEQLILPPVDWADSTDHSGTVIPDALLGRWNGPYLESGSLIAGATGATPAPDTLLIALDGQMDADFDGTLTMNTNNWLTVGVTNYTVSLTQQVSDVIDGDTVTTNTDAGGRVRWDGTKLLYYILPIN